MAALDAISALVLQHPAIGLLFNKIGGEAFVSSVGCLGRNSDRDVLLASSRRALVCVRETEVLSLICEYVKRRNKLSATCASH